METLNFTASVDLTAAADKTPRASILAYGGSPMHLDGHALPVVVDLSGMEMREQIPLLVDHDMSRPVGHGTPAVQAGRLFIDGVLSFAGPDRDRITAAAKEGFPWQASIGAKVASKRQLRAGETITVNGQTVTAGKEGLILVNKSILGETSFVVSGADPAAAATIQAKDQAMSQTIEATEDQTREADRIRGICRVCHTDGKHYDQLEATAIQEGWNVQQTELEVLRASRPQLRTYSRGMTAGAPNRDIIAAATMIHAGRSDLAEKSYGEQVVHQATELRCHSLIDLCAAALRADHRDVPGDRNELIQAAVSTSTLPLALGNFAEKSAADSFRETPRVWDKISRRRTVNTFHEHKIIRLLVAGRMSQLPPGGEIRHGALVDDSRGVQAKTSALMLGIDRTHIINDDLGLFADTAAAIGRAAARAMNDNFAREVMAGAGTFFHANNNNLGTTGTALSATSLAAAIANFYKRTDPNGQSVDIRPRILMVPPELEFTARQLLSSAELSRAASGDQLPTGNPLSQQLELVVEPRLSNTAYTGNSTTAYYLFATPADGAVNVALLGGRATPTIESEQMPFNKLGIQYRGYIDFGFALGEHLAAYKATGAA
jgi:hypothetical protein